MMGIFKAIGDFFKTIIGLIVFIFKGLMLLFNLLFKGLEILMSLILLLPTPFIVGGVALITVCVLYKVLGRENQS